MPLPRPTVSGALQYVLSEVSVAIRVKAALGSLKTLCASVCVSVIGRVSAIHSPKIELIIISGLAVSQLQKEKEEVLIQRARNLINEGVEIHSLFRYSAVLLAWLREHCAEELRERAAVTMKGLELIDFDTCCLTGGSRQIGFPLQKF